MHELFARLTFNIAALVLNPEGVRIASTGGADFDDHQRVYEVLDRVCGHHNVRLGERRIRHRSNGDETVVGEPHI